MVVELLAAFGLGVLSTSNPCALTLYPGFIAYLARESKHEARRKSILGLAVVAGVISSMLLIGLVLDIFAVSIGRVLTLSSHFVAAILIILGVMMLLNSNPFGRVALQVGVPSGNGYARAYAYGTLYGPISIPCIAPLLLSVLASSLLLGESLSRLLFFVIFAVGLSLPLFIIAVLTDTFGKWYVKVVTRYHREFMIVGGIFLLGIAAYTLVNLFTYGRYFI